MKFRTEIEPIKTDWRIDHNTRITLLGSCFTDEIGRRLSTDGFDVVSNPLGPMFNPESIYRLISFDVNVPIESQINIVKDGSTWHCLDLPLRYSGESRQALEAKAAQDIYNLQERLSNTDLLIITLGTAWVYTHKVTGQIVGNCHKLHPDFFSRRRLTPEEVESCLGNICFIFDNIRVMFTVSPVRHIGDTLHGNQLSKAALLLGSSRVACRSNSLYFPAYEILMDDLRDYRFYADDLKHPSAAAVDYIYELFASTFFSRETRARAEKNRREARLQAHIPIITPEI